MKVKAATTLKGNSRCDVNSIVLVLGTSISTGFYYGFACYPVLKVLYTSLFSAILVLLAAFANLKSLRRINGHKFYLEIFIATATVSILIPMFHWVSVIPEEEAKIFIPRVLQCLGVYFLGFAFFGTRFPERSFPGRFDYVFNSHQFWHACVFFGAWIWGETLIKFAQYREGNACVASNV
mmetsp:Transcript_3325/g.7802  ORF Transcript_3325/g.7802 Transcript_3325/m.7802 type:complete len:180 (+) Transcript_3325:60-599(+)